MRKKALITGVTGQDGSYLAEFLLTKDYDVYGLIRRTSTIKHERIQHIENDITLIPGDMSDQTSLTHAIMTIQPDEVYNLAAQSFVQTSWSQPVFTGDVTALGVTRLLDAIRAIKPDTRFYQASSSEMFGKVRDVPQKEDTPFYPRSPYGVAKVYGHWITVNYRESYDMHVSSGILFNHESPRRGLEFVTRKVTYHAAAIKLGLLNELRIGNLDSQRDWGFAGDYVEAMWRMLQADNPRDYVIGTGVLHSVRDLIELAFASVDLDWQKYVEVNTDLLRRDEHFQLVADPTRAKQELQWSPRVTFEQLIEGMVQTDLQRLQSGQVVLSV